MTAAPTATQSEATNWATTAIGGSSPHRAKPIARPRSNGGRPSASAVQRKLIVASDHVVLTAPNPRLRPSTTTGTTSDSVASESATPDTKTTSAIVVPSVE